MTNYDRLVIYKCSLTMSAGGMTAALTNMATGKMADHVKQAREWADESVAKVLACPEAASYGSTPEEIKEKICEKLLLAILARSDFALAERDVAWLPDGCTIEVVWSGGNGPHQYKKTSMLGGLPCAEADGVIHRLEFLGQFPPFTTVKLISGPDE